LTLRAAARTLRAMMRVLLIALGLLFVADAAHAQRPRWQDGAYNDTLVFGMTRDEVQQATQSPLVYLSGPRGSERYLIERRATVPGWYPVDTRIVLQFRRNRLTGWRRDWQMRPYWF
jgi:hypothetical protein